MEHKTLSLSDCEVKLKGDSLKFSGYASVFNGVDSYRDTILPGAYADTLKQHGLPRMFWSHNTRTVPPGKWTKATEDGKGLLVEGEMTPGNQLGAEIYAGLKHGTLDGLSIGFRIDKADYTEPGAGGRIIRRVTRLFEVSPVVWPADGAARVDTQSIKSVMADLGSVREVELFLRAELGAEKPVAVAIIARMRELLERGEPAGQSHQGEPGPTDAQLRSLTERLARTRARMQ